MNISTVTTHALWNVSTLRIAALAAVLAFSLEEPRAAQPFDHQHVYSPDVVYMPPTSAGDYPHASPAAMERWYDRKFGLRIHWGIYSILGEETQSWALNAHDKPWQGRYHELYKTWNPAGFNADEWMKLMQDNGLKFFVFTAKHHDGFSMYDTQTKVRKRFAYRGPQAGKIEDCDLHYSIMEAPFKRDVVRELVDAARRHGVAPGLYFSHIDWYDADFRLDPFGPNHDKNYSPQTDPAGWARFLRRHREQIEEILGNYGPIGELSLDIGFRKACWPEMEQTIRRARQLQPDCLFRHRGIGAYGDYWTPEQEIPRSAATPKAAFPWQVIHSLGRSFAYASDDAGYRSGNWILSSLIDIVAQGGLFMVGIGPDGNGRFHPKCVEAIEYAGRWLKVNGEAIFATRPWTYWKEGDTIRFTRGKDHKFVYAICLKWPGRELALKSLRVRAGSQIRLLGDDQPLTWRQNQDALTIELPDRLQNAHNRPCELAYAFKLEQEPQGDLPGSTK